jgi:hypothetical protein
MASSIIMDPKPNVNFLPRDKLLSLMIDDVLVIEFVLQR